jgi:hypothetical protein
LGGQPDPLGGSEIERMVHGAPLAGGLNVRKGTDCRK